MPRDGTVPHREGLPQDDLILKLNDVQAALTQGGWIKNSWKKDGKRCLGQIILDTYGVYCDDTQLPKLSITAPILEAAFQVTGTRFSCIQKFNDASATTLEIIHQALNRARNNILGIESNTDNVLGHPAASTMRSSLIVTVAVLFALLFSGMMTF